MNAIKNIRISALSFGVLAAAFFSCTSDRENGPGDGIPEGTPFEIELAFPMGAGARANFTPQEAAIEEVDVLVFRDGIFQYRSVGKNIRDETPGVYDKKIFQVVLTKDSRQKYELVVIANAHDAVQGAALSGNMNNVLSRIEFEHQGVWPAAQEEGQPFKPIPMWGKSAEIFIDGNTEALLAANPIELFRSMARIDLAVEPDADFELTRVFVYNYNTRGLVAPGPDADWFPHYITGEPRVRNVTLPEDPGHVLEPPLEYNANGNNSCKGAIFLMETHKADPGRYRDATCLILEGKYDGSEELSYYRLDLRMFWVIQTGGGPWDPGGTSTIIDEGGGGSFVGSARTFPHVLRNHVYDITVRSVSGPGYPTKEQAFENPDFEIYYVENVQWQSRYIQSEYEKYNIYIEKPVLEMEQTDDGPDVYTDQMFLYSYSDIPLEIEIDPQVSWLRATHSLRTLYVEVDKDMSIPQRTGFITVRLANFTKKIRVTVTSKP